MKSRHSYYRYFIPIIIISTSNAVLPQDANKFDVLGTRIGMNELEISAAVKKNVESATLLEKVKYQPQQGLPESVASVLFCYGEPTEANKIEIFNNAIKVHRGCQAKIIKVLFTRGSAQAFKIERTENYAKVTAPSVNTLLSALNDKYGIPTTPASAGLIAGSWYIDDKGDTKANSNCSLMLFEVSRPAYRQYPQSCGFYFNYNVGTQIDNSKLAARFILTSFDFRLVNTDLARVQDSMSKSDKARQENELKSSKPMKM